MPISSGLLKQSSYIPKTTLFIGFAIIASAVFTRQMMDFTKSSIGKSGFAVMVGIAGIIFTLNFLVLIIKSRPVFLKFVLFLGILLLGVCLTWQMRILEERFHLWEFAILGWFAARDMIKRKRKIKGAILACLIVIAASILDELFQGILPYRYFDWRDIHFNNLGGLWGIILYYAQI